MLISSTIVTKAATVALTHLTKWGYKKLSSSNYSAYEAELERIIMETIQEYERQFKIEETNKIPFYTSQAIFDELIKYRLTKELDKDKISHLLKENPQIISPTTEQLEVFLNILFQRSMLRKN